MLDEFICDSAWANRSHRGWTTLGSFAAQTLAIGMLLLLPLLYTEGLPKLQWAATLTTPEPPPAPSAPYPRNSAAPESNLSADNRVQAPSRVPTHTSEVDDRGVAPAPYLGPGVPGGTGRSWSNNPILDAIAHPGPEFLPAKPPTAPASRLPLISHSMEAYLVHRVQPEYPPLAKAVRVQGEVLLYATISREGTIENLRLLSGHPLLVPAAMNAVRQWRYRPYYLNGEPVEVETQITVRFVLTGGPS